MSKNRHEIGKVRVFCHNREAIRFSEIPDFLIGCLIETQVHEVIGVRVDILEPRWKLGREVLVEEELHPCPSIVTRSRSAA